MQSLQEEAKLKSWGAPTFWGWLWERGTGGKQEERRKSKKPREEIVQEGRDVWPKLSVPKRMEIQTKTDEKEVSFESGTPIGKPDLMGSKEAD